MHLICILHDLIRLHVGTCNCLSRSLLLCRETRCIVLFLQLLDPIQSLPCGETGCGFHFCGLFSSRANFQSYSIFNITCHRTINLTGYVYLFLVARYFSNTFCRTCTAVSIASPIEEQFVRARCLASCNPHQRDTVYTLWYSLSLLDSIQQESNHEVYFARRLPRPFDPRRRRGRHWRCRIGPGREGKCR